MGEPYGPPLSRDDPGLRQQPLVIPAVLLPERFRAGCAFGATRIIRVVSPAGERVEGGTIAQPSAGAKPREILREFHDLSRLVSARAVKRLYREDDRDGRVTGTAPHSSL